MMRQIEWRRVANHFEGAIDILFAARPWGRQLRRFHRRRRHQQQVKFLECLVIGSVRRRVTITALP
jgi:hypothetical protein